MKDKIKELLGAGLEASVVAAAVGVDDSYISQLLSQEDFAAEVSQLKLVNLTKSKELDRKYDELEDEMVDKLKMLAPMMTRPLDVVRTLQALNSAKRRHSGNEHAAVAAQTIVPLVLPAAVHVHFAINGSSQVVEVGGRSIATMPANNVVRQLADIAALPKEEATEKLDAERAAHRLASLVSLDSLPLHEQL